MTHTKLGRLHVPDSLDALERLHFHHPAQVTLREVDHEPRNAVLDQEDLLAQGIRCSEFIAGAGNPDALGSCTCNTLVEALTLILTRIELIELANRLLGLALPAAHDIYADTRTLEMLAIVLYHQVTDQTGDSSAQWPPVDCGSSGPYLYKFALARKLIGRELIAHGAENIVSLMQRDGVLIGSPWLNAWFEPDPAGFIDGDGRLATLQAQIRSGLAGGHEFYGSAIEKLALLRTGEVDPLRTVIRCRNHWTPSWGDHGSFRIHLSTYVALAGQVDVRQFIRVGR